MVESVRFVHFRCLPGKRELLAPPGHGCAQFRVPTVREGIGVITSRKRAPVTDDEFRAWTLGISIAELKRRRGR